MPRLINNPLTAPGKLWERSPWGLRFTTDTNISGENQQGIKWPEAHREWHSWVPAFFKKKQLLQSSGGKSTNMVAWRICYRLLSISVLESWARPQQWFGCGGWDSAESLHKPLQVHHQPPRAVFLWKCNQVMPGGWPKEENQPIQNT